MPRDRRVGSQLPRVHRQPPDARNLGDAAVKLAGLFGLHLDPWQQAALRACLGQDSDRWWTSTQVGLWVSRQNGKGSVIEALVLFHMLVLKTPRITWSAHQVSTAGEGFERLRDLILGMDQSEEQHPDPAKQALYELYGDDAVRAGAGKQSITTGDGTSKVRFVTRSKAGSRGFGANLVIFDEAQEITQLHMAALGPILAARSLTKPGVQRLFLGTPPLTPDAWAYDLREKGEAGAERTAWFDHGLDLPREDDGTIKAEHLEDRDNWAAANPALGLRISEDFLADELTTLGQAFALEHLGVWLPRKTTVGAGLISAELWADMELPQALRCRPADVAFGIDVNPSRSHSSIGWAGRRDDGQLVVGLVDYRPGTHWVVQRVKALQSWVPIGTGLDLKGPAGSFLDELEKVDLTPPRNPESPTRGDLGIPSATDVATGFAWIVDAARERRLHHVGDAPLTLALHDAGVRSLVGGSAWDRKGVTDISPLCAVTTALWLFLSWELLVAATAYDLADSFH